MSLLDRHFDAIEPQEADVASRVLPAPLRHRRLVMVLHWSSVLLLFAGVAAILWREALDGRAAREWLLEAHAAVGSAVLVLAALRLAARRPLQVATTSAANMSHPVLHRVAGLAHAGLYLLLLLVPALGWALMNARGKSVALLGIVPLPTLLGRDRDLADVLQSWHTPLAWVLLGMIAAHMLAAFWHHIVRRDAVLPSMVWWVTYPRATATAPSIRDASMTDAPADPSHN